MTDLTAGIRRAAAPERARGAAVPSTAGVNSGDPVLQAPTPPSAVGGNAAAFPKLDAGHKSMGWHELTDVEVRAYTETVVALTLTTGQSITIDATAVQVWRIAVSGSVTVNVVKPTFPTPATPRQDAPERMKTWSTVLIISVPSGGTFPTITGVKWPEASPSPNLLRADGSEPTNYGGVYVMTLMFDPIYNEVLGFEAGCRF